jgi:hypothetical protein
VGDQAPRSRRSATPETSTNTERDRDRAAHRGPRRYRILFAVVGGLLGPGYWLCGVLWDGRPFGKSPAEIHFTEFVLAMIVVVVASWGLLLILGEALLFALAVFRADDKEQYDVYRNLMILWGYVLTLGIPRHFRRLPAQFGALNDDVREGPANGGGRGGQGGGRDRAHGGGAYQGGGRRAGERPRARDQRRHRDTEDVSDGNGCRREDPRDRTGCQNRAPDRGGPWDQEDVRDHTACRKPANTAERRRVDQRGGTDGTEREGGRRRPRSGNGARRRSAPEVPPAEPAATLDRVPGSSYRPLGPIFPPRPAADAEVATTEPAAPVERAATTEPAVPAEPAVHLAPIAPIAAMPSADGGSSAFGVAAENAGGDA